MPGPSEPIATLRAVRIRAASESDMAAVRDIYAHYVLHSLATFEETPPTLEEMLARRSASVELGLPYLVAEAGGEIVGFAYAAAYRARPAYRFTIEDSVYVADGLAGRGVGSALLGELIACCEQGSWRQMVAVVGDSANSGSIALHRRLLLFEPCQRLLHGPDATPSRPCARLAPRSLRGASCRRTAGRRR